MVIPTRKHFLIMIRMWFAYLNEPNKSILNSTRTKSSFDKQKLSDFKGWTETGSRELTTDQSKFTGAKQHDEAFATIQRLFIQHPVLKFYNIEEEVTIQTDASNKGLGAVLLQNGQPVAYTSRTLSPTEQRYATIEKECLGMVFACERFNQYLARREQISVETDHKPLESIFKKSLLSAPYRLQRMLLRLQRFNLTVKYKPGSQMLLADHLSRAAQHETSRPE